MKKYIDKNGYVRISGHGDRTNLEHRYVMEQHLKRRLGSNEVVHHKDEDKTNNELSNLEVMSRSEHNRLHTLESMENFRKYGHF